MRIPAIALSALLAGRSGRAGCSTPPTTTSRGPTPRPSRGCPRARSSSSARPASQLPRHAARLLGLRAHAVRPRQAGLRLRQPGRHPVQRAGRLRQPDRQEGDAGRRSASSSCRARCPPSSPTPRSTASTAATNTTASATPTPASCSTNCCPTSRSGRPPTAGRSGSRRTATTAPSAAPAAGPSPPSPPPGSGPTPSSRVFSAIGTYVGLRGGNDYPTLIRKFEPKPIRVFLQDGCNDQNIYGGDWWMANQEMERALTFAGYEVRPRLGRRRPQRQAGHRGLPRRHALALEGLARAGQGRQSGSHAAAGDPHPRRGLAARRRGLQVHRRPGGQRQGRGVLQRRPQRQDLQGRPRRQGQPLPRATRRRRTARPSAPTAASTPSHGHGGQGRRLRRRRARPR